MTAETAAATAPVETAAPAVAAEPVVETLLPAKNTDAFTQSTRHCTRRAWDVFLSVRNDLNAFNTHQVRARIEAANDVAAQRFAHTLRTDGNVTQLTLLNDRIECTTTLAAIQLIIKDADFKLLDAVAVD